MLLIIPIDEFSFKYILSLKSGSRLKKGNEIEIINKRKIHKVSYFIE